MSTFKLGCYDFSLHALQHLVHTGQGRRTNKLDFCTRQLSVGLQHYNRFQRVVRDRYKKDYHDYTAGSSPHDRHWPEQDDWTRSHHEYLKYVKSQSNFHTMVASGMLRDLLCQLPNLQSVTVRHQRELNDEIQPYRPHGIGITKQSVARKFVPWATQPPSLAIADDMESTLNSMLAHEHEYVRGVKASEYAKDGELLASTLQAIAHNRASPITELNISIDGSLDFALENQDSIYDMLNAVESLHYGSRRLHELSPAMTAVMRQCSQLQVFSTRCWGKLTAYYDSDILWDGHIATLMQQSKIWPVLKELHMDHVAIPEDILAAFLDGRHLSALTITNAAQSMKRGFLKALSGARIDSLVLKDIKDYSVQDYADLRYKCYFPQGITANHSSNPWLLDGSASLEALDCVDLDEDE